MSEEELKKKRLDKEALIAIDIKFKKVMKEINAATSSSTLEWKGKELLHTINELTDIRPDYVGQSYDAVAHTLDKEVQYVKYAEKELKGKNTPKVRYKEHEEELYKAKGQIHSDVFLTLTSIEEEIKKL